MFEAFPPSSSSSSSSTCWPHITAHFFAALFCPSLWLLLLSTLQVSSKAGCSFFFFLTLIFRWEVFKHTVKRPPFFIFYFFIGGTLPVLCSWQSVHWLNRLASRPAVCVCFAFGDAVPFELELPFYGLQTAFPFWPLTPVTRHFPPHNCHSMGISSFSLFDQQFVERTSLAPTTMFTTVKVT